MIVASIDVLGGRVVQLEGGDPDKVRVDAGDAEAVAARFGVLGELAVIDLDAALGRGANGDVIRGLLGRYRCRVGGGLRSVDAAVDMLNAGAHRVILGTAATREVCSALPRGRVCAALDARRGEVVTHGWTSGTGRTVRERMDELGDVVGSYLVTFVEREGRMGGLDMEAVGVLREAAGENGLTVAGGVRSAEEIAALDAMGVDVQAGMAMYRGALKVSDAVAGTLRANGDDRVVVGFVDVFGRVVGLGSAGVDGVRETIEAGVVGAGVDAPREVDGARVAGVRVSEDRSSVVVIVDGGRGRVWDGFGVADVDGVIGSRRADAPAGSYTRRLFDEEGLAESKLREEVEELIAAKGPGEAAWEAADVVYFALVIARTKGVGLREIEAELMKRSRRVTRRKGDAK